METAMTIAAILATAISVILTIKCNNIMKNNDKLALENKQLHDKNSNLHKDNSNAWSKYITLKNSLKTCNKLSKKDLNQAINEMNKHGDKK